MYITYTHKCNILLFCLTSNKFDAGAILGLDRFSFVKWVKGKADQKKPKHTRIKKPLFLEVVGAKGFYGLGCCALRLHYTTPTFDFE